MIAWGMDSIALSLKLLVVLGLLTLLLPSMRDAWIEVLKEFVNKFRGGPPTAMHPSPVDDAALLRRRRRRKTEEFRDEIPPNLSRNSNLRSPPSESFSACAMRGSTWLWKWQTKVRFIKVPGETGRIAQHHELAASRSEEIN